jgi:xanthine/uracil permease
MTRKVSNKVIAIATTLLILILTKKSTRGLRTIAIIVAKTTGIIIFFAMYRIANKAIIPMIKMVAFA